MKSKLYDIEESYLKKFSGSDQSVRLIKNDLLTDGLRHHG